MNSTSGISPSLLGNGLGIASSRITTPLDIKSPEDKFLEYARMTPAERIREAILKELGISEDELAAMDHEARDMVEKQIAEKIKEKLTQDVQKRTGMMVDVSA